MQRDRRHLLYVRTLMLIGDQRAAGIKGASDGAVVVKHKVRVVPLAAELKRRRIASSEGRVVVHIKICRLALEIGAGSLVKVSAETELVCFTARRTEKSPAGNLRFAVVDAAGSGAVSGRREAHIENVVAGEVGMEASPAVPLRNEVKVAAHIERPRREHRADADG